jgi:hypothetical protein
MILASITVQSLCKIPCTRLSKCAIQIAHNETAARAIHFAHVCNLNCSCEGLNAKKRSISRF